MKNTLEPLADSVAQLATEFHDRHRNVAEEAALRRPSNGGWTLKEIVGHLIDSAGNNHQRITRLQLAPELRFPGYENEKWLAVEQWNGLPWQNILSLFLSYNLFLAHLIRSIEPENLGRRWFGRDRSGDRIFTLEEMIVDYRKHLQEHLEQFENQFSKRGNQG